MFDNDAAVRLARDIDAALLRILAADTPRRDAMIAAVTAGKPSAADVALLALLGLDAARYAPPP